MNKTIERARERFLPSRDTTTTPEGAKSATAGEPPVHTRGAAGLPPLRLVGGSIGFALLCAALALTSAAPAQAQVTGDPNQIKGAIDAGGLWLAGILGSLSLVGFLIGAGQTVLSGANSERHVKGFETMKKAGIGFLCALLAWAAMALIASFVPGSPVAGG